MTTDTAQLHVAGESRVPDCPYVGLVPFGEQEAAFFFGREREVEIITANMTAARLTLLYAPSGVGKSSVLRAGVVPALRRIDDETEDEEGIAHTTAAVAYVSEWSSTPLESVGAAIRAAVAESLGRPEAPSSSSSSRFGVDWLRRLLDDAGVAILYLILDQFEEYFFYHSAGSEDSLTQELGDLLTSRDVNVHVLLSVREDAVAALDRFKGRVPHLFSNYLRLAQLDREAGRTAIEGPLREYNLRVPADRAMAVDPLLVDDLLEQVRAGRLTVDADQPSGSMADSHHSGFIEAPYLQLVLIRVWEQERTQGSGILRRETLAALGGAQTIVQCHLDEVVASLPPEQVPVAAAVFRHLVTASGSKIALAAMDLAAWSGQPVDDVEGLLESLSSGRRRILRPVPPSHGSSGPLRYEIFHDVMGAAVLEWRRQYLADLREQETSQHLITQREEARREAVVARRRLRYYTWVSVGLVLVLVLATAVGWLLLDARTRAQQQARLADAAAALGNNPQTSLTSAVEALSLSDDTQSRSAVLEAASAPRSTIIAGPAAADGGITVLNMKATPSGDRVVGFDREGRIIIVGPTGEKQVDFRVAGLTGPVLDVVAAPDDSRVVVATDSGGVWLVDIPSGRRIELPAGRPAAPTASWFGSEATSRILVLGSGVATVFDPLTGSVVAMMQDDRHTYWAIGTQDGQHVVTSDYGDAQLRVWDAATGAKIAESDALTSAPGFLTEVDNRIVGATVPSSTFDDQEFVIWDWRAGSQAFRRYFEAENGVQGLAVNPLSNTVLIAFDKTVNEYLLAESEQGAQGALFRRLPQQPDWVNSVSTSPDGDWALTAGNDGKVQVWFEQGKRAPVQPTYELVGSGGTVIAATFLGDGVVALEANGALRWWPLPRPPRFTGHTSWVIDVAVSQDGNALATASSSGYGNILRPADVTTSLAQFGDGEESLQSVRFDPTDAHRVITLASYADHPRLWQWHGGDRFAEETIRFESASTHGYNSLTAIAVSPDGATVVAGDFDGGLHFWDSHTGRLLTDRERTGNGFGVGGIEYDRSGALAVTTREGIRLIDLSGAERLLPLPNATYVAVDPTGRRIAGIADGGRLVVWTQGEDQPRELSAHGHRLGRVAFNRDGTRIAVGTAEGLVEVWDVQSGLALTLTRQHGDSVNAVRFAPDDDNRIISASDDTTVASWLCESCADPDMAIEEAVAAVPGR